METTNVNVQFPKNLDHKARIQAAVIGVSKSELIRRAVAEYLQKSGENDGTQ